jgi:hypothetical protein
MITKTCKCKSNLLLGVMSCSPTDFQQHFGGTHCLQLQLQRISQARNQQAGDGKQTYLQTGE